MRHFAHALEDLPEEVRQQAAEIAATEPGLSLRQRLLDEVETAALDLYGALEQAPLLRFLARYGAPLLGSKPSDAIVAYALPKGTK